MTLSIMLCGQGQFAVDVASAVMASGHDVVQVCSPAASRSGRPDRLGSWAARTGVAWTDASVLRSSDIPGDVDVIVAAHAHAFISRPARDRARLASIGYHPSLLPLHRGRDAIRWTLRDGDRVTGGTVYHLTDSVDAGPIAAQDWCFVPVGATPESLWREHLAPMGVRLIVATLGDIAAGRVRYETQDERLATWEPSWERPPLHRPELAAITDGTEGPLVLDASRQKHA